VLPVTLHVLGAYLVRLLASLVLPPARAALRASTLTIVRVTVSAVSARLGRTVRLLVPVHAPSAVREAFPLCLEVLFVTYAYLVLFLIYWELHNARIAQLVATVVLVEPQRALSVPRALLAQKVLLLWRLAWLYPVTMEVLGSSQHALSVHSVAWLRRSAAHACPAHQVLRRRLIHLLVLRFPGTMLTVVLSLHAERGPLVVR
jgi:hypothetical protein